MIPCVNEQPSKSRKASDAVETTTHSTTPRKYPLKHKRKFFKLFWNILPPRLNFTSPRSYLLAERPAYYFHIFEFDP